MPTSEKHTPCLKCEYRKSCPFLLNCSSYETRLRSCPVLAEADLFFSKAEAEKILLAKSELLLQDAREKRREAEKELQEAKEQSKRIDELYKANAGPSYHEIPEPAALKYSYSEFIAIAFDIDTPNNTAVKYQKALIQAKAKGQDPTQLTFKVPTKGRIRTKIIY